MNPEHATNGTPAAGGRMMGLVASLGVWAAFAAPGCAGMPENGGVRRHPAQPPIAHPSVPPEPVASPSSPVGGVRRVSDVVPRALIAKMRAELATRIGTAAAAAAHLVGAAEVVWPDGGLGCAQPGEVYTQALVPGYRVEFEAAGRRHAYHANASGYFRLCLGPGDRLPKELSGRPPD